MRSLFLACCTALLGLALLGGCVLVKVKPLPPGHVMKATGVNPASGKVKVK